MVPDVSIGGEEISKLDIKKEKLVIPPVGENIRIIPLGGVEEVGKNMYMVEYGDDIIVIDVGFAFKSEETPGIDYILPNTEYLEERKKKIQLMMRFLKILKETK